MRNKRGQFYLLVAIIVIAVVLGFAAMANSSKKTTNLKIYDLGEELGIESGEVLDFGTYKQYDSAEMDKLLTNFSQLYGQYAGEGKEIYFIYGNESGTSLISSADITTGVISESIPGSTTVSMSLSEKAYQKAGAEMSPGQPSSGSDPSNNLPINTPGGSSVYIESSKVKVRLGDAEYEFDLEEGQNFYFILSQEVEGEQYIISG